MCVWGGVGGGGRLRVQLWCMYSVGHTFYPFSCNVADVLIKHILAWLTKCAYESKPTSVFNFLPVVKQNIDSITCITYRLLFNF